MRALFDQLIRKPIKIMTLGPCCSEPSKAVSGVGYHWNLITVSTWSNFNRLIKKGKKSRLLTNLVNIVCDLFFKGCGCCWKRVLQIGVAEETNEFSVAIGILVNLSEIYYDHVSSLLGHQAFFFLPPNDPKQINFFENFISLFSRSFNSNLFLANSTSHRINLIPCIPASVHHSWKG